MDAYTHGNTASPVAQCSRCHASNTSSGFPLEEAFLPNSATNVSVSKCSDSVSACWGVNMTCTLSYTYSRPKSDDLADAASGAPVEGLDLQGKHTKRRCTAYRSCRLVPVTGENPGQHKHSDAPIVSNITIIQVSN